MRVTIRVTPGARRPGVEPGGDGDGPRLLVKVAARPVDGGATEAALAAVADALGVRRRHVRLVAGATSRTKVVEVDGEPGELGRRLGALDAPPRRSE